MNTNKLPGDPLALVLGIIALVIGFAGCCCYGVLAIIPLIMAIIGLVVANKSIKEYNANPDVYAYQSRSNIGTAKVINIIAIVFNGLLVLSSIVMLLIYGTIISSAVFDSIKNERHYKFSDFEQEQDSINQSVNDIFIEEKDTLVIEK